jgi:hypothetical protein
MKSTAILLFVLMLVLAAVSCSGRQQQFTKQQRAALDTTEKNRRPFNPNMNADTTKLKAALTLEVRDGQVVDAPARLELIPSGVEPHRPTKGTFTISYSDSAGRELGRYTIPNPMILRSCDDPRRAVVTTMKNGQFLVTVPYTAALQYIRLSDDSVRGMQPVQIDVRRYMSQRPRR